MACKKDDDTNIAAGNRISRCDVFEFGERVEDVCAGCVGVTEVDYVVWWDMQTGGEVGVKVVCVFDCALEILVFV